MVKRFRFTIKQLDNLKIQPVTKRTYHYDSEVPSLCILTTPNGTQTFYVYKKVDGKPTRIKLGRRSDLSIENARKKAQLILGEVAMGKNPNKLRKEELARQRTLEEVFNDYLTARQNLKQSTINDYHRLLNENFSDWKRRSILSITKDQISKRHSDIGQRSEARANLSMRFLRALFNFASGQYEDAHGNSLITENPVKRLSHTKAWYRVERRNTYIKPNELPAWFDTTCNIQSQFSPRSNVESVRDYLLFILFTGLRRSEAMNLTWDNVDFANRTFSVPETKNHKTHTLPFTTFTDAILQRRNAIALGSFVFPGSSPGAPIIEPRKVMKAITDTSGVTFTIHDLRRTFITIAESLDLSFSTLKYLLNHSANQDVTSGYIIMTPDRVREPMQIITNKILSLCNKEHHEQNQRKI